MPSSDITFCANNQCPRRESCKRGQRTNTPYPVSMALYSFDEKGGKFHCNGWVQMYGKGIKIYAKN